MYGDEAWSSYDNVGRVCNFGRDWVWERDWVEDRRHAAIVVVVAVVVGCVIVVASCFFCGNVQLLRLASLCLLLSFLLLILD